MLKRVFEDYSKMREIVILLLGVHFAYSATHSLRYYYIGVSGYVDFPEFTAVGFIDGVQFMYFDSNINKAVPKTDWIRQNVGEDYWTSETQIDQIKHERFQTNIKTATERFNQTQGVHTFQEMYGCEWDDQTGATNAFEGYGYDGEDFLSLDFKEMRYISPVPQGIITTQKWNNEANLEVYRNYFSSVCIEWLQKYVQYGKSSLEKTVSPQVSLVQKSSSSPVSCHVTGFYPSAIKISWMKNGEDHDDVDLGELLPNEDGTFQRMSTLNVKPEERKNNKFSCVVEHQGQTKTETVIRNNEFDIVVVAVTVAGVVLLVFIAYVGINIYWRKKGFKGVSQESLISEKSKSQIANDTNFENSKSQTSENSLLEPGCSSGDIADSNSNKSSDSTSDIGSQCSVNSNTPFLRKKDAKR